MRIMDLFLFVIRTFIRTNCTSVDVGVTYTYLYHDFEGSEKFLLFFLKY